MKNLSYHILNISFNKYMIYIIKYITKYNIKYEFVNTLFNTM